MRIEVRKMDHEEMSVLSKNIQELEDIIYGRLNWLLIMGLVIATILSAIHIYYYDKSNWSLPSKLLVISCPIFICGIIGRKYDGRNTNIKIVEEWKAIQLLQAIKVTTIKATRVIKFEETENEGILYLIESNEGNCFYLWDDQYLIPEDGSFPCDIFEVYLDEVFIHIAETKIRCIGEKIKEITISGKHKWTYLEWRGIPYDFENEQKGLDEVMKVIENF